MSERRQIVSSEKTLEKIRMGSTSAALLEFSVVSKMSEAFLIMSHRPSSLGVADLLVD